MKRRAAVEPVIGHLRAKHRMGRNDLKGPEGDRINAVLAAAGYNFGLLLRWLAAFACPHPGHRPKRLARSDRLTILQIKFFTVDDRHPL